jgi:hypothetical protein
MERTGVVLLWGSIFRFLWDVVWWFGLEIGIWTARFEQVKFWKGHHMSEIRVAWIGCISGARLWTQKQPMMSHTWEFSRHLQTNPPKRWWFCMILWDNALSKIWTFGTCDLSFSCHCLLAMAWEYQQHSCYGSVLTPEVGREKMCRRWRRHPRNRDPTAARESRDQVQTGCSLRMFYDVPPWSWWWSFCWKKNQWWSYGNL